MATALSTATISKTITFNPLFTDRWNERQEGRALFRVGVQGGGKRRTAEVCTAALGPRRDRTKPDRAVRNARVAYIPLLSLLLSSSPVRAEELEEIVESTQEYVTSAQESVVGAVEDVVDYAGSAVEEAADLASDFAGAVVAGADGFASEAIGFASEAADLAQDAAGAVGVSPELAVGAAAVGIPILLFSLFRKGYAGDVSAKDAFNVLLDEKTAVLLDVREKVDIDEVGSPKVPGKKLVTISFETLEEEVQVEDTEFASKASAVKSLSDVTVPVYVIDRFGPTAVKAAKVLTKAGYKQVFAIADGAEGPRGWKESGLAWKEPFQPFKLDLEAIKEAITSASYITEGNTALVPTTLGATAALGLGILAFSEVETALQLLGSAALAQVFLKKFLFAEDRKQTIKDIQSFLDTKVAPASLVEEFKEIGNVLTADPSTMSAKPKEKQTKDAAPAPTNGSAISAALPPPTPVETAPEPSVPAAETPEPSESPSLASSSTDPDLKPPTSPTPSEPTPSARA